jgi:hypothetical protein
MAQLWARWIPGFSVIITTRLANLDDRGQWRLAVPAVSRLLDLGLSGPLLHDVAAQLAERDLHTAGVDDPGRDRPARRRLSYVVDHAAEWSSTALPELERTPLIEAGQYLASHADFTPQAVQLLLAAVQLGPDQGEQLPDQLSVICDLLADQPVTASRMADALAMRVGSDKRAGPDAIRAWAASLELDGGLCAGLFAVALATYGGRLGWPAIWRAQVQRLRAHHLPDVRTAALAIHLAAELELDCWNV